MSITKSKLLSNSQMRENVAPAERGRFIRTCVALVTVAVIITGVLFADSFGSSKQGDRHTLTDLIIRPAAAGNIETVDGGGVFAANCAACHQATGTGVPGIFPPLDGSEWVMADDRIVINILLHGIQGEIKVKDVAYKGMMPSFAKLSDGELAAVATYIRSHWSNKAAGVSADQVAKERKAAVRTTPFTNGTELRALSAKP